MTVEAFERDYRYKKPVIVKFQNGAKDWTNPKKWSLKKFDTRVRVVVSNEWKLSRDCEERRERGRDDLVFGLRRSSDG